MNWLGQIREHAPERVAVVMVGNKVDLARAVSQREALALAESYHVPYFEASARTGAGVYETFLGAITAAYERLKQEWAAHDGPPGASGAITLGSEGGGGGGDGGGGGGAGGDGRGGTGSEGRSRCCS